MHGTTTNLRLDRGPRRQNSPLERHHVLLGRPLEVTLRLQPPSSPVSTTYRPPPGRPQEVTFRLPPPRSPDGPLFGKQDPPEDSHKGNKTDWQTEEALSLPLLYSPDSPDPGEEDPLYHRQMGGRPDRARYRRFHSPDRPPALLHKRDSLMCSWPDVVKRSPTVRPGLLLIPIPTPAVSLCLGV